MDLWRQEDGTLIVPRGLEGELHRHAPDATITDHRLLLPPADFHWRGELRPEQKTACRAAHSAGGVVVGPCGSGKTVMGLAMVAAWRQPCLWIVHTIDLAKQSLDRAQSLFDLPPAAFGMVGDGKATVGTHLTVATVQTLARRDLSDLAGRFGAVVVDEAHRTPTNTHTATVQAFPARYRLGLTATPDRADGLGGAMLAVLGPVAAHLTTAQLARAGRVVVPSVRFVATRFRYRYADDYGALLGALCEDPGRNALIVRTVAQEAHTGHTCLVLSERVEHCHALADALAAIAPDVPAAVLTGEATARQRAATLGAMRDGRLRVLFATKLADEGLDLPALDRVFLTTGGRAAGRLAQQVGRAMRAVAGKRGAKVIDFTDPQVGVLAAQSRARQRDVYLPLGARIEGDRPA